MTNGDRQDPALKLFGVRVQQQRKAQQLTQERLGELTDLDASYVAQIEQGRRNPTLISVLRIANGLGVDPAVLVSRLDSQDEK